MSSSLHGLALLHSDPYPVSEMYRALPLVPVDMNIFSKYIRYTRANMELNSAQGFGLFFYKVHSATQQEVVLANDYIRKLPKLLGFCPMLWIV